MVPGPRPAWCCAFCSGMRPLKEKKALAVSREQSIPSDGRVELGLIDVIDVPRG